MNSWLFPIALLATAATATGCGTLSRVDRTRFFSRDGWSLPDRVVAALRLPPGARVADLGAGDGYFTFRLAEAVGAEGHVYAVEIDAARVEKLRREVARRGVQNVSVLLATADDSKLADTAVDLVFLCGVFHHLEEAGAYVGRLRAELAPGGRIAIVEGAPDPLHKLFMPFHFADAAAVRDTMAQAGYGVVEQLDFLPTMNFQIFR